MKGLSPSEMMRLCRTQAREGTFVIAASGIARLERDELSATDVRSVLATVSTCRRSGDGTWYVEGRVLDGTAATVMVAFDGDTFTVV